MSYIVVEEDGKEDVADDPLPVETMLSVPDVEPVEDSDSVEDPLPLPTPDAEEPPPPDPMI
jgi:hypothetical protein